MWSSGQAQVDPVRFAEVEEEAGPLFLWVGVMPGTLSRDDVKVAAVGCKQIIAQFQITDVEIAFRGSVVTRSAGPRLLNYLSFLIFVLTADVHGPFTPALGLPIATKFTPHFEGTGGLYIFEGGESNRIFVLTARHVVLPPSLYRNDLYVGKPRRQVILFGNNAYHDAVESIMGEIGGQDMAVSHYKDRLEALEKAVEGEDVVQAETREYKDLKKAEKLIETLHQFHSNITKSWTAKGQRILGHVAYAPPIFVGTGDKRYTEDWALVELYREKIDWKGFKGNMVRFGTFRSIL